MQIDHHKTLPCLKVSPKNSHFLRKLRTKFLGIYCANETNIQCFFYDNSIGTAGPNKVIFLLNHLLTKLETENGKYNHLIVWSDNALGEWMWMLSLLDMINNPRFSLETAVSSDPVINSCSEYPLEEPESVTKTISCHLHMMAKGHLHMLNALNG